MEVLQELMNNYKYTKETIANELGITALAVDNWIKGRNQASEENRVKLYDLLWKVKKNRKGEQSNKSVVIPNYVAQIIERYKREEVSLLDINTIVWNEVQSGMKKVKKLKSWLREQDNQEVFINAWTKGYSIKEADYVIVITEQFTDVHPALGIWSCYVEHTTTRKDGSVVQYKGIDNCQFNPVTEKTPSFSKENHSITTHAIAKNVKYKFTKNEIKEIDERFLPFAKEVK